MYIYADGISPTYTSNSDVIYLFDEYRKPNKAESCFIGSYPQDYKFIDLPYYYLIGMSVPPLMTGKIAEQVYNQWISKL